MKVVVLTGPESAGKSSLCTALAQHFRAPVVREYVREYIELQQRDTCYTDVDIIAREQWRREQAAKALCPPLLLLDTNLLSNLQWSLTHLTIPRLDCRSSNNAMLCAQSRRPALGGGWPTLSA